jgi:hypothetical protein
MVIYSNLMTACYRWVVIVSWFIPVRQGLSPWYDHYTRYRNQSMVNIFKMKQIFVIFTLLLTIEENSSLDFVKPKLGWTCSNNFECSTRHSCPYWAEKDVELNHLKRGSSAEAKMIEEYKSAICNKEEKGLCCPRPPDIVKSSDKECPSDRWCTSADSCKFWNEKRERLRWLSRWTMDYKNLKKEIISAICNKKKKALCCPKVEKRQTVIIKQTRTTIKKVPIKTSPTYLPLAGDCGTNPQKTPAKVKMK